MTVALELLRGKITYESAAGDESDILTQLAAVPKYRAFCAHLSDHTADIQDLVSHHLGLTTNDTCFVTERKEWIRGGFNLCVPVQIQRHGQPSRRVLMRFPMPHAFAESADAIDELISCQAGTSAWQVENLPDIPLVELYGFAFSDGRTVRLLTRHLI